MNTFAVINGLYNLFRHWTVIKCRSKKAKGKGEEEKYTHLNTEFQRTARRDKKAFLSDQCKEIEKTIEWERLAISSGKLEIPGEHFIQR